MLIQKIVNYNHSSSLTSHSCHTHESYVNICIILIHEMAPSMIEIHLSILILIFLNVFKKYEKLKINNIFIDKGLLSFLVDCCKFVTHS